MVTKEHTMAAVERFEQLLGRLRIREKVKIDRGVSLVAENVDVGGVLAALKG